MIFCRTYQLEQVLLTLGQRFVILKVSRAVVITLFRIVCQIIKLAGFTAAITLSIELGIIISLKYTVTEFLTSIHASSLVLQSSSIAYPLRVHTKTFFLSVDELQIGQQLLLSNLVHHLSEEVSAIVIVVVIIIFSGFKL